MGTLAAWFTNTVWRSYAKFVTTHTSTQKLSSGAGVALAGMTVRSSCHEACRIKPSVARNNSLQLSPELRTGTARLPPLAVVLPGKQFVKVPLGKQFVKVPSL